MRVVPGSPFAKQLAIIKAKPNIYRGTIKKTSKPGAVSTVEAKEPVAVKAAEAPEEKALTPREQFDYLVRQGTIPDGSEFVGLNADNQIEYYSPQQVQQRNTYNSAISKLKLAEKPNGEYDINKLFDYARANKTTYKETFKDAGLTLSPEMEKRFNAMVNMPVGAVASAGGLEEPGWTVYSMGGISAPATAEPDKPAGEIPEALKDYPVYVKDQYRQAVKEGRDVIKAVNDAIDYYNGYLKRTEESRLAVIKVAEAEELKFRQELKESDPYLYGIYVSKGADAYNEAVAKRKKDLEDIDERFRSSHVIIGDEAMTFDNWNELPFEYQRIAVTKGFDAMFKQIDADNEKATAEIKKQDDALNKLKIAGYMADDGTVDIFSYLQDIQDIKLEIMPNIVWQKGAAKESKNIIEFTDNIANEMEKYKQDSKGETLDSRIQVLKDAGFSDADIDAATYNAKLSPAKRFWQQSTPWDEYKGETVTLKGGAIMAGDILVPGFYVGRNWNSLSGGTKGFLIAIDALSVLIPATRAGSLAARSVAGYATRAGVLTAALKGFTREAMASVIAPLNVIIHPVGTAKYVGREIRNIAENVANPRKIPSMTVYTSEGTVRLAVTKELTKAEAIIIRDKLMDAAVRGEKVFVKYGGKTFELARSPLMKELPGSLAHSTPIGEMFGDVLKVSEKSGMPLKEQGLFVAHEPIPKFAPISAYGKTGPQPTIFIMSPYTARKTVNTSKLYESAFGTVAEMERKLPIGETVAEAGQKLYTRLGPEGTRVEIWLEKGVKLSPVQIAKLKAKGLIEYIKAPFQPALKISGGGKAAGITTQQAKELANILRRAGAKKEAAELLRAERLARASRASIGAGYRAGEVARRVERTANIKRYVSPRRLNVESREAARYRREIVNVTNVTRRVVTGRAGRKVTGRVEVETGRLPARTEKIIERISERPIVREQARPTTRENIRPSERPAIRTSERPIARETIRPPEQPPARITARPPTKTTRITPRTPIRVPPVRPMEFKARPLLPSLRSKQQAEDIIKKAGGAIAWRMGEVTTKQGKKPRWDVIVNPYQSNREYMMVLGKAPDGATIIRRGKGSAYATAQMIYGQPPSKPFSVDSGFMDINVSATGPKITAEFKPDPKGLTTGDITIGEKQPRISNRQPRISGKTPRISGRVPVLR